MENDKYTVLIVEDDQSTSAALQAKLEEGGFVVNTAKTGAEGLESVKEKKPDIILLDVLMPVMGGAEVFGKLKSDDQTKDIPVIVLTNVDAEGQVADFLEKGTADYLLKADHTLENIVEYVKSKLS